MAVLNLPDLALSPAVARLVPASLNQGKPVVLAQPQSEISTAVRKLAQKLAPDSAPAVVPKKGLRLRRR